MGQLKGPWVPAVDEVGNIGAVACEAMWENLEDKAGSLSLRSFIMLLLGLVV